MRWLAALDLIRPEICLGPPGRFNPPDLRIHNPFPMSSGVKALPESGSVMGPRSVFSIAGLESRRSMAHEPKHFARSPWSLTDMKAHQSTPLGTQGVGRDSSQVSNNGVYRPIFRGCVIKPTFQTSPRPLAPTTVGRDRVKVHFQPAKMNRIDPPTGIQQRVEDSHKRWYGHPSH